MKVKYQMCSLNFVRERDKRGGKNSKEKKKEGDQLLKFSQNTIIYAKKKVKETKRK